MKDFDYLIRYAVEYEAVEFKLTAYTREKHDELLRDVLAMANAPTDEERYIICGLKVKPDGERIVRGVERREIVDAATYQNLVHDNITPAIPLDYFAHEIDGRLFAVLRIGPCTEQPYAMRKKFDATRGPDTPPAGEGGEGEPTRARRKERMPLEQGHMWIRKGTRKAPIEREDLERIYRRRYEAQRFSGMIRIGFDALGEPKRLALPSAGEVILPSDRKAARIREILADREAENARLDLLAPGLRKTLASLPQPYLGGGRRSLDERDSGELRGLLKTVKKRHELHDEYELYELWSHHLNFAIRNEGTEHVQAARFEVEFPPLEGVLIADEPLWPPVAQFGSVGLGEYGVTGYTRAPMLRGINQRHYPDVQVRDDGSVVVSDELEDVRHQFRTVAFAIPLRVVLGTGAIGAAIPIRCTLHGRNLTAPVTETLMLTVEPPDGSLPREDPDAEE